MDTGGRKVARCRYYEINRPLPRLTKAVADACGELLKRKFKVNDWTDGADKKPLDMI
jgi:hypothetical protein